MGRSAHHSNFFYRFFIKGGIYRLSRHQSYGKPGSQCGWKHQGGGKEEGRCSGILSLKTKSRSTCIILIGIYLGATRSFLIISAIPVFNIRPHYSLRPYLQSLAGTFGKISSKKKINFFVYSSTTFKHDALLNTCELVISPTASQVSTPDPCVLVFYTHHRPHLAHRDMQFFTKAKERGWACTEIYTKTFPVCDLLFYFISVSSTTHPSKKKKIKKIKT